MSNQQVNQSVPKHNDGLQADQFDENILVFDNIFSRGYGFSPQVLTRLAQLSIVAKGLYSYFSSFAGQGGVAFPSTQTILKETNISKNRLCCGCLQRSGATRRINGRGAAPVRVRVFSSGFPARKSCEKMPMRHP